MNFLSVKHRITLGLVTILLSTTLLVIFSGFGPDARQATMRGRGRLCESIAIYSSILISQNNVERLEQCLAAVVARDEELLSAGVRRADGNVIVQIGDHTKNWKTDKDESTDTQVQVPLWSGESAWGDVELRFRSATGQGITGFLQSPWTLHLSLVGAICWVFYSFYLRMVLRQLDPSQAIPKRVRSALDALAEGLLVTDKRGCVVLANEAFARWAGQDPDKLIGSRASSFPWGAASENAKDFPWITALRERVPQANHLLQLTDTNKTQLTLVANSSPVLGHDGEYRGVLTSFEDVTELEQHKVELSNAKHAADEANQAKSDFLARMSHEIRTPMNAILGYTEVLRRGFAENEQQRSEYLSTIHNSGEHLLALINDILDLSKVEAGRIELELARHSLQDVLMQVASVLRVKADEKGLSLQCEWESELPETILTDAVRLRQAIINLVGNAIKFTEHGGVRVVARLVRNPKTLIAIDVIDTGIGMPEEASKLIFEPFSQADTTITRRYGGTGLGLSISKQLAEQMGGGVSVESELGKGTTFTLTIDPGPLDNVPLVHFADIRNASDEQVVEPRDEIVLPPSRVLVVDDGEENRQLVALFLRRVGLDVATAENGQVAIDMLSENRFDAVLMDMQMPVMDGITATRQLREGGCTTPIIALTANVMKDDEDKCREAGFTGFLTKPINMDRLLETLSDVLPKPTVNETSLASIPQRRPASSADTEQHGGPERLAAGSQTKSASEEQALVSSLPTDDPEFVEIVQGFVGRLRSRVREMRQVTLNGDYKELAEMAHWLKGAAGSVGFDAFTVPAAELQASAKAGNKLQVEQHLRAIERLTDRIRTPDDNTETDGRKETQVSTQAALAADGKRAECEQIHDAVTELLDEVQATNPVVSELPTDDPEFQAIVEGFVSRLRLRVEAMKQAAATADFVQLAQLAHWLKGAGGSVGFPVFTTPAAELQQSAKSHDREEAAVKLRVIEQIVDRIHVEKNEPSL